jgi:tape measure domain-containing protein
MGTANTKVNLEMKLMAKTFVKELKKIVRQFERMLGILKKVNTALGRVARTAASGQKRAAAATEKHTKAIKKQSLALRMGTKAIRAGGAALAVYAGTLGVGKLLQFAEAAQTTTNRLRVAQRPGENLGKSFNKIANIAKKTRQPLVELATMYQRITLATKGMNVTQAQAFKITENFGKLLTIQGASAHEARSALTQFTQALQSGKLAGDEFRSISENLPPVLDALVDATKRPRDQLKLLAEEGKLSTDLLLKAMLEIDKRTEALKRFGVAQQDVDRNTFGALGGASPVEQAKMSEAEKKGDNISTETLPVIKRNMDDLIQTFMEFEMAFKDLIFNTITKQFAGGVGDAFADMVVAGKSFSESMKTLFQDMAKQVISQITKMIVQMLLMKALMAALGLGGSDVKTVTEGGGGKDIFGALKGVKPKNIMKGFGFAGGGRVTGGGPYVVGEEGPELFTPSSGGTITPNDEMGGAMGGGVIIQNLSIMPNSSIDQALMDKPASYWLEMAQEKILPALNTLGQGGETTTMEFRGVR